MKAWKRRPSLPSKGSVKKRYSDHKMTDFVSTPEEYCQEQKCTENKDEQKIKGLSDSQFSEPDCPVGISNNKGIFEEHESKDTPVLCNAPEEINDGEIDQVQPMEVTKVCLKHEEKNRNQTAEVVIAMTSLSVDVDDAAADIIDDSVMSQPHKAPLPPPSVDDRSARDNTVRSSDNSKPLQLPDLLSSHEANNKLSLNKPQDFFCYSSPSENYIQICASSNHGGCKKRSALVFPDLMADVGECLCSRGSRKVQQPAVLPDLFTMLPDLITSHGFHSFEVTIMVVGSLVK